MELERSEKPARAEPGMRQVARNTVFMLAGQAGVKLLGFIFSVFVVRRLGAADFGRYSAALAFVAMFSVLTDLGTSQLSVREMARLPQRAASLLADLVGLRFVLSIAALFVIPAIARRLGEVDDMVFGIFLGSLTLVIYAAAGPVQSLLIARERLDILSMANVLNQALFIALGTLALVLHSGFLGLLVAALLAQGVSAAVSVVVAHRRLAFRIEAPSPRRWPPVLRSGLPFFISQVSDISMQRFDVVFLLFALNEANVGWYSVAFNLPMTILPLAQSLGLALFPSLVRQHASGAGSIRQTLQRAVRYVLLLSLPIAVGGCLLADRIVNLLYTSAFEPSVLTLRILLWTLPPLFLSEIVGRAGAVLHLEVGQARISIVTTLLSAVLVVAGVEAFGLVGAALAAVLTRLFVAGATLRLIGPTLVLEGNVAPLLRIAAATVFMGAGLLLLLAFPPLLPASAVLALLSLIGSGVGLYATAVLALQAVDLSERRFLLDLASGAFRRLASRA